MSCRNRQVIRGQTRGSPGLRAGRKTGSGLYFLVFRAGDNLVLQLLGHVVEVVAVAGNADEEVAVLVGVLLCVEEGGGVDNVELDVMAAELEVGADEVSEFAHVFLALQQVGHEADVEECAAALRLVEFAE